MRVGSLTTAAADWVLRSILRFIGGLPDSKARRAVKKLVAYGVGLPAPSLALIGIFRELALVGTGNGGATVFVILPGISGALGLLVLCVCSEIPFARRALRRTFTSLETPKALREASEDLVWKVFDVDFGGALAFGCDLS